MKGNAAAKDKVLEAKKITPLPHVPGGRVPTALSAVAMKALTLEKWQRYQNVAAVSADIEKYQGGFATSAEQAGAWKQFTLFVKRHKAASIGAAAVLLIGVTLGTQAIVEGRRANRALADLKQNAPAMLALAESEAVAQHFESALAKTDAAIRLDPALLPAYWRRAWSLIALGRFSDAAAALRAASERDSAHERQFGTILPQIEKIAAVPDEAGRYAPELLTPIFEFLQTHDASGEASALIEHLRLSNKQRFTLAQERLKALGGSITGPGLRQDASGLITLSFSAAKLNSLDQVRGIPCDILWAEASQLESLELLRGLRLCKLELYNNRISDLSPLRGMALVHLNLMNNSAVGSLSPLAGMPLTRLSLLGIRVSDLSPLVGMPLKDLNITSCSKLKDLTPLLRIPTLERLETDVLPDVLAPLRQHPKLALINYRNKGFRPVAEVWAELAATKAAGKK